MTGSAAGEDADARQRRYWNSAATAPWVTLQDRLDTLFAPLTRTAIDRAAPTAGERVLDVGCGCGATVLELAARVGPRGHVEGLDISAPMLARARERVAAAGLSQVALALADAARHDLAPASLDLIFSRLGVMFFGDPVAAFGNLRRALKPSGRMVFVSCRSAAENRYITTAVQAARPLLPAGAVLNLQPDQPGMFSLADPAHVQRLLAAAGFGTVELLPLDQRMQIADRGGAADGAAFSLQFGPLAHVFGEGDAQQRAAALAAVTQAYREIEQPHGIMLDGAFWIVTARP